MRQQGVPFSFHAGRGHVGLHGRHNNIVIDGLPPGVNGGLRGSMASRLAATQFGLASGRFGGLSDWFGVNVGEV